MLIKQFADVFRLEHNDNHEPIFLWRRGDVYDGGWKDRLGVWCESSQPQRTFDALAVKIPGLTLMQLGEGECTFTIPASTRAEGIRNLRRLGAHKVREFDAATRERMREAGRRLAQSQKVQRAAA